MVFNSWRQAGAYCLETFGVNLDLEEGFFECPECGEPIYFEDWKDHEDWSVCPVCECLWEEVE